MAVDYVRLKEIVFLLWDNELDYNNNDTQTRIGSSFHNKHRVYNELGFELDDILKLYQNNTEQEFLFFVHLDHNSDNKGMHTFLKSSDTLLKYPNLKYYFVSRVPRKEIYEKGIQITVYDWEELYEIDAIDRIFIPQTIFDMKQKKNGKENSTNNKKLPFNIKYAIFTALFEEFKEVDCLFEWNTELQKETGTIIYKTGKLKGTEKYAVACFAGKTGMTEAAVICSEMINKFEPEYIIMPGVCGGSDKTEFGDVIIANKVFLLGKGKTKDLEEVIDGQKKKAILHYKGKPLELNQITDTKGNYIRIIAEEFENEIESIEIDELLSQKLEPNLKRIEEVINNPYKLSNEKINVRFAPMACSLSVVDKEDYFEYEIKGRDRKTKAVEMESYGVARAAKKANGGKTKFLIIKSVMDKTEFKTDAYKEKAAYTSAQFLKYLIEYNIL
jgi:nucleoside phosphorylase